MEQDRTYEKIRAALRDMDHSALSWNGVNVFGDRKSIDAIRELTNIADRARAMGVYIDESKKIAATREKQLADALALNAEMLAALKELLPEGWGDDDGHMDHMPGVKKARLAIAKAEGAEAAQPPAEQPPYPFCHTPDLCAGKGRCQSEIACND